MPVRSIVSNRRRRELGVSLLEVLVSILLAAIGLLALAGSNVAAIRYSKLSQYRGTAALLAADLGERMRANKAGAASYDYQSDSFDDQIGASAPPAASTTCEGWAPNAACTTPATAAASVAAYDLTNWRRLVRSQLPQGSAFIAVVNLPAPPAGQVAADVWIAWNDPAVANPDENSTDARNIANECPNGLSAGADKSIRCAFFRINL